MRFRWTLASLIVALSACGHTDTPAAPPVGEENLYSLVSGNGQLPFEVTIGDGQRARMFAGSLLLKPDGSYIREHRDSVPQPTGSIALLVSNDYGTWTQRGDSIFLTTTLDVPFRYPNGRGVRSATSVRVSLGSIEYLFQKK